MIKKGKRKLPFFIIYIFIDSIMDLLQKHKTIRNFKQKEISDQLVASVISDGCRASTTGNMQLYSVVVTRSSEMKSKLISIHFNQPVAKSATLLLTVCADFNRFTNWCLINKANPGYDNFLSFLTASIDALLFAQNLCISAEDKGLGICYLGTATYNSGEIIRMLGLPKLVFPITCIALGWPNEIPDQTDRLPLEAIVHNEVYQDHTEGDLKKWYALKENLKESQKFVQENKKQNLAQVFTDVRYKGEDNRLFSDKIVKVLKEQGFLN